jgi:hypothetical protein
MRISRTLILTATVAAAALTLSSVPAHAVTLSPSTVADAYSVMLNTTQAKLVGIGKTNVSNFGVASSTKGSPDAPWLCDLSADTEIKGKGAQDLISSQVLSTSGKGVTTIAQEIHWFANDKRAKKAYNGLVSKIKGCEGQQTPTSEPDDDTSFSITTKLTNGEKKSKDGDAFLWVNSETTIGDLTTNFADHDYTTVRLFGNYIQIIELESGGANAPALTKKQMAETDRLTDSLGDAWRSKFM